jgi:hypothetical protein
MMRHHQALGSGSQRAAPEERGQVVGAKRELKPQLAIDSALQVA